MIGVKVRTVYRNDIPDSIRRDMVPLIDVLIAAHAMIDERVFGRGLAADGAPWSDYVLTTRRWHWVPPSQPQPAKNRLTVVKESGKDHPVGWAAYKSYAHYKQALGELRKNFAHTGQVRRAWRIRGLGATKARLEVGGTKRRDSNAIRGTKALNNAKVAYYMQRKERMSPAELSRAEVARLTRLAADLLPARVLKTLRHDQTALNAARRAKRLVAKAKRAKAKLIAARETHVR